MRKDQAVRLLACIDEAKIEQYTIGLLNQLRHIQKITWITDTVFTLPFLYNKPIDECMLSAMDIMLDLTESRITALTTNNPPYKLCFFTGQENHLNSYAVIVVAPGSETTVTASLCNANAKDFTVIFILSDFAQKDNIKTPLPHFFAILDNGRYRYFEGGN